MGDENTLAVVLRPFANSVAARYGYPVYLVGSALDIDWSVDGAYGRVSALRDVDVVCILPDDVFENRFGASWEHVEGFGEPASRWATEVGKISRWSGAAKNLNVDFKVQSEQWVAAREEGKPRLRIDGADFEELSSDAVHALLQWSASGANELLDQMREVSRPPGRDLRLDASRRIATLEAELREARADLEREKNAPCSVCAGSAKLLTGGTCTICSGTGLHAEEVIGLRMYAQKRDKVIEELKRKATDHLRQRDEARAECERLKSPEVVLAEAERVSLDAPMPHDKVSSGAADFSLPDAYARLVAAKERG